jgi:hypothetical protein
MIQGYIQIIRQGLIYLDNNYFYLPINLLAGILAMREGN